MADDCLRLLVFAGLGRFPLGGRDFLKVAGQRRFDGHAFARCSLHVRAAHHLVFGTARPVFGV